MAQARLERLDPAARRVLRAASVFGETFWRGGVEAILGEADTAAWLAVLVDQDMISVKDDGRFPAEMKFQHKLVWEAVCESMTEDDRAAGRRIAEQWLEQATQQGQDSDGDPVEPPGSGDEPSPV
jgi:predicted ATPase